MLNNFLIIDQISLFKGFCPIFTSNGYIDWKPCNMSDPNCPNISYKSDQVYKCMFLLFTSYVRNYHLRKELVEVILMNSMFATDSVCFGNNTPSEER